MEKPVRIRGKTPVTLRTSSRRHSKVRVVPALLYQVSDKWPLQKCFQVKYLNYNGGCLQVEGKQAAGDQTPKKSAENVVEDILANELSTPIGIG